MGISSVRSTTLQNYPQYGNPANGARTDFTQSLAAAADPRGSASVSSGTANAVGTSAAEATPDYTHMTPNQFYAASEALVKAGKITMDEGFQMQMMARTYEWRESQAGGSGDGNDNFVDFVAAFKDTRAFNATHGGKWSGPGCDPYTGVLNVIDAGKQGGVA